jgi:hypothetical protein
MTAALRVPIAIGDLIDKITILEIKAARIGDATKLRNVQVELMMLNEVKASAGLDSPEMKPLAEALKVINMELWDIENDIRDCEARGDFGKRFIVLARGVYRANDRRSQVKQKINLQFGSQIVEEKSYSR